MLSASCAISPRDLWTLIGTADVPLIVDVRRRDVLEQAAGLLPVAVWRDAGTVAQWPAGLDRRRPVVLACKAGHALSQAAAAHLTSDGFDARVPAGGYAGVRG